MARNWDRPLDKEVFELYGSELEGFSEHRLELAFTVALQQDTFWPTVARLRELAGALTLAQEAREALYWCLDYIRLFGVAGRALPGYLRTYERDPNVYEPDPNKRYITEHARDDEPPPAFNPVIQRTLEILGGGNHQRGLEYLDLHPYRVHWKTEMNAVWLSQQIGDEFRHAYERAKMESAAGDNEMPGVRTGANGPMPAVRNVPKGPSGGRPTPPPTHPARN